MKKLLTAVVFGAVVTAAVPMAVMAADGAADANAANPPSAAIQQQDENWNGRGYCGACPGYGSGMMNGWNGAN